jgi:hypothetical protein
MKSAATRGFGFSRLKPSRTRMKWSLGMSVPVFLQQPDDFPRVLADATMGCHEPGMDVRRDGRSLNPMFLIRRR